MLWFSSLTCIVIRHSDSVHTVVLCCCLNSVEDVNKKIRYMRSQYGEELRKSSNKKSGMGAKDMYVSKWKYYQRLGFLQAHVNVRKGTTTCNLRFVLVVCIACYLRLVNYTKNSNYFTVLLQHVSRLHLSARFTFVALYNRRKTHVILQSYSTGTNIHELKQYCACQLTAPSSQLKYEQNLSLISQALLDGLLPPCFLRSVILPAESGAARPSSLRSIRSAA